MNDPNVQEDRDEEAPCLIGYIGSGQAVSADLGEVTRGRRGAKVSAMATNNMSQYGLAHSFRSSRQAKLKGGGMSGTSFIHGGKRAPMLMRTDGEGPIM